MIYYLASSNASKPSTSLDPDQMATSAEASDPEKYPHVVRLSEQLLLEELWETLSRCLVQLAKTTDHHAVLVLQPAVEAFFLIHAGKCDAKQNKTLTIMIRLEESTLIYVVDAQLLKFGLLKIYMNNQLLMVGVV